MMRPRLMCFIVAGAVILLAGCASKRVHEPPILENGDRVPGADGVVDAARAEAGIAATAAQSTRDSVAAAALAGCAPDLCAAVARGELAIGMTYAEALAATRTTAASWRLRQSEGALVMVPAIPDSPPADAVAPVAIVQLRNGRVASYGYHESAGLRLVATQADATRDGRATALADLLIREGDDLTARGDLDRALDRYDRAQVLKPGDAVLDYRIATVLDKQLRPVEALIRYQLFLHRLELERIGAVGVAYARLAEAIAHARERVLILERQAR